MAFNGVDDLLALKGPEYVLSLIEGADADADSDDTRERKSQATALVDLASCAELFHTPDRKAFATVEVGDHRETVPLRGRDFRDWLSHLFYLSQGKAPGASALQDAVNTLSGRARYDGEECEVHTRVAGHEGNIYLDLCDPRWRAVRVTPEGWEVVCDPPVKFRRARGMLPLPEPARGGSLEQLRGFINVGSREDWVLLCSWLIAALRARGPFPVLALHGEQGSAKSTTARLLRSLIDPNTASLRSEPRGVRDLMIAAANGWCVALDNVSKMPPWLSDALCRLSTGGGFATRELYADDEEVLFDAQRPVLLNGIEEMATRPDLLDRSIIIRLLTIPEERRRQESDLWREFEAARPGILGALLDAVCAALSNEPRVKLRRLPRMADFAVWATAAEPGMNLEPGTFMAAYAGNREEANDLALEASPVAAEVLRCMEGRDVWTLSYTDLLAELEKVFGESPKRPEGWPKSARGLAGELTRVAPNLRKAGVNVEAAGRRQGGKGRKLVTLTRLERGCEQHSPRSQSSQSAQTEGSGREHRDEGDEQCSQSSHQCSQDNCGSGEICEGCERGECQIHTFSESGAEAAFNECEEFFKTKAAESGE